MEPVRIGVDYYLDAGFRTRTPGCQQPTHHVASNPAFVRGRNPVLQFRIEMNCSHTPLGYEHNIYLKGNEYPVYTETVQHAEGHILGNFWASFVEYGLPHVISS